MLDYDESHLYLAALCKVLCDKRINLIWEEVFWFEMTS